MATELKDVLEAVLIDLVEARHAANEFSMSISPRYTASGDLSAFATPSLDIGNVKVDLRFAVRPPEQAGKARADTKLDDKMRADLALGAIRGSVLKTLDTQADKTLKARDRQQVSMRLANALQTAVNPSTLSLDKRKARSQARQVLADKSVAGRVKLDERLIDKALDELLEDAGKRIRETVTEKEQKQARKAAFVVDSEVLNKLDPATISTLSLDLDMSSLEWTNEED